MSIDLIADPTIYLAMLLVNIVVIFVFYVVMSESARMHMDKNVDTMHRNLHTVNAWWLVLTVMLLAVFVSMQSLPNAWGLLLIIPMINLAVAAILDMVAHRWEHMEKLGITRKPSASSAK